MDHDGKARFARQALRFTLGGTAFVAGLDKFFNLLTDWEQYISPVARENLPMKDHDFMRIVGVVEMAVGGLILSGRDRVGGYAAAAWLLAIAANLLANGDYDIAVRDVNMAVAAAALAELAAAQPRGRLDERRWMETRRAA
jgi:uncharacterized membrane protein YphA (DoxX/SURF4 family)